MTQPNRRPWVTRQASPSTHLSSRWLLPIFSRLWCSNKILLPSRTFRSLSQSLCLGLELQPHLLLMHRHFKHTLKRKLVVSNCSRTSLELNDRSLVPVQSSLQRSSSKLAFSNRRKLLIYPHNKTSVRRLSSENLLNHRSALHSLAKLLRHISPNNLGKALKLYVSLASTATQWLKLIWSSTRSSLRMATKPTLLLKRSANLALSNW